MEKYQVFDPMYDIPELEEEFTKFFKVNGLDPLFTNEHRASPIKVSWADARSVVNDKGKFRVVNGVRTESGGAWHSLLKEFAQFIVMANDNQNYENMLFKILYNARDFKGMMRNIKLLMDEFKNMPEEYMHNMWNVVKYEKILS